MNLLVLYTYGHDTFTQILISKNIKIYSYKLKIKYTLNQTKKMDNSIFKQSDVFMTNQKLMKYQVLRKLKTAE